MGRTVAMHLHQRLPLDSIALAAHAGLQDTAPRAALLSLHARVEDVTPSSWEDGALAQVWGPRLAAYLVPADAIASFTLGRLPRDPEQRRGITALADRVHAELRGEPMRSNTLFDRLGDLGHPVMARAANAEGRFVIRWDARTTTIVPIERPDTDEEDARRDLAQRYVDWFGPSGGPGAFARWAGIGIDDAELTWARIDERPLPGGDTIAGVRLLPMGDPYLYGRPALQTTARELPGAILVDGRIAGTWARQQANVTLRPARMSKGNVERAVAAAHELAGPIGRSIEVTVA